MFFSYKSQMNNLHVSKKLLIITHNKRAPNSQKCPLQLYILKLMRDENLLICTINRNILGQTL